MKTGFGVPVRSCDSARGAACAHTRRAAWTGTGAKGRHHPLRTVGQDQKAHLGRLVSQPAHPEVHRPHPTSGSPEPRSRGQGYRCLPWRRWPCLTARSRCRIGRSHRSAAFPLRDLAVGVEGGRAARVGPQSVPQPQHSSGPTARGVALGSRTARLAGAAGPPLRGDTGLASRLDRARGHPAGPGDADVGCVMPPRIEIARVTSVRSSRAGSTAGPRDDDLRDRRSRAMRLRLP